MTPRDRKYLDFVRSLPCCICGTKAEAHHAGRHYTGVKPSDYTAIPLCHPHHMELHRIGHIQFQGKHQTSLPREIASCLHLYVSGERLELPVKS